MKRLIPLFLMLFLAGCASSGGVFGTHKIKNVPPEFHQTVMLLTTDRYESYQATRSNYDIGDLQSFHSQHTFPMTVEEAFKEMFDDVTVLKPGEPRLEMGEPDEAGIFEVNIIDLAHDNNLEANSYRSLVTVAAAMKSPSGKIFWQQAFRGEGYYEIDDEFSTGMGPEGAVIYAVEDAMDQMQQAIIKSPQVKLVLKHYQEIQDAKRQKDLNL